MPVGKCEVIVERPIAAVWEFISDMENWAPLIPGYIRHEKLTERQSLWIFKETVGILKKKIELMVKINEWNEPTRVAFSLKGVKEKFVGEGCFEAEAITDSSTKMTGSLEIQATGPMAAMTNAVLKNSLPKTGEELTGSIAAILNERIKEH